MWPTLAPLLIFGVHQDGLVHISAMSEKFIDDPRKVVKAGDIVKVKVMDVDVAAQAGLACPCVYRMSPDKRTNAHRDQRSLNRDNAVRVSALMGRAMESRTKASVDKRVNSLRKTI